jgi:hypothetical protein
VRLLATHASTTQRLAVSLANREEAAYETLVPWRRTSAWPVPADRQKCRPSPDLTRRSNATLSLLDLPSALEPASGGAARRQERERSKVLTENSDRLFAYFLNTLPGGAGATDLGSELPRRPKRVVLLWFEAKIVAGNSNPVTGADSRIPSLLPDGLT